MRGLVEAGANVLDIGQCGTEMIYHTTAARGLDGGIMVTASHNPMDHNGMKLVRSEAKPVSGDTGLNEIGALAAGGDLAPADEPGRIEQADVQDAFIAGLLEIVDTSALRPLKIVANGGNGCAGPVVRDLAGRLPGEFIHVHDEPDGNFPNGIPNPLLPENRGATADAVRSHGADLGLAWDGDFDRCFFFDETGAFIEGYYLVGLLARASLGRNPGAAIVRDFAYCDSGMLPWLLVWQEMSTTGRKMSELVAAMQAAYPASGEINRRLADPQAALALMEVTYGPTARGVDRTDGLSLDMGEWRFNLRMSNTEPVIRLNVESRGDGALMEKMTAEILGLLDGS